nr:DUF6525 family protein [Crenalkalicoccus roseus]
MLPPWRGGAPSNDGTIREAIWRRFPGDEWAAYEALPPAVRRRMQEHAYDPWAVNALLLWRAFRRQTGCGSRAERRLLHYLDLCEALERAAFAAAFVQAHGTALPHVAAKVEVLRRARRVPGPAFRTPRCAAPRGTGGRRPGWVPSASAARARR